MSYSIFIDGAAGTTGLQVADRLARHPGVNARVLSDEERKDNAARQQMMAASDLTILCLPDVAAREAAAMAAQTNARLIDASSAHRTHVDWVYGFAELMAGQRDEIADASRISNPGCYPTGFLALTRPLVDAGIVPRDALLSVPAVSGFSGGGNGMIIKADVLARSIDDNVNGKEKIIYLSPKGKLFNHEYAKKLSSEKNLNLVYYK